METGNELGLACGPEFADPYTTVQKAEGGSVLLCS